MPFDWLVLVLSLATGCAVCGVTPACLHHAADEVAGSAGQAQQLDVWESGKHQLGTIATSTVPPAAAAQLSWSLQSGPSVTSIQYTRREVYGSFIHVFIHAFITG
jgi:hypothetical protein